LGFVTGENAENLKATEAALFAKVVFFRYLLDNPVKTQDFVDMTLFDWDVFGMSDINEQLVSTSTWYMEIQTYKAIIFNDIGKILPN